MITLDYKDGRPLYEQIKEKIKFLIIRGVLKPDEKVPSVRDLAQSLTINPNTIQKAYKDLETAGYLYSVKGKGNFVSPLEVADNSPRKEELLHDLKKTALELKYLNVSQDELKNYLEKVYEEEEGKLDD